MANLTARKLASTKPGKYADGNGLYLIIEPRRAGGVTRRWAFIWWEASKGRELGLGSGQEGHRKHLTLAEAREVARAVRLLIQRGQDPKGKVPAIVEAVRNGKDPTNLDFERRPSPTFEDYAEAFIKTHGPGWKNKKTGPQWTASLKTYAFPRLHGKTVDQIEVADVLRILRQEVGAEGEALPFWQARPETASRVRNRIEAILDAAKAERLIPSPWQNPAGWRGNLKHLLPKRNKLSRGHHARLPFQEIPEFTGRLRQERHGVGALALEFALLTAARTSEVRGATWAEIDLEAKLWTVPAARMKAGREHRVPLSDRAVEILQEVKPLGTDGLVFPGTKRGKPISDGTLERVLDRMEVKDERGAAITVHGFRSSFRDWASEVTSHSGEVVEMALAHTIANRVEAAYRRGDLFEKRRRLMDDWAEFCAHGSNVIPIRRHG